MYRPLLIPKDPTALKPPQVHWKQASTLGKPNGTRCPAQPRDKARYRARCRDNSLNLSTATSIGSLGSALLKMCLDTQPPSRPEEERGKERWAWQADTARLQVPLSPEKCLCTQKLAYSFCDNKSDYFFLHILLQIEINWNWVTEINLVSLQHRVCYLTLRMIINVEKNVRAEKFLSDGEASGSGQTKKPWASPMFLQGIGWDRLLVSLILSSQEQ